MPHSADIYPDDPEPRDLVDEIEVHDLSHPAPVPPGWTTADSTFPCPYCGEENDLFLEPDPSRPDQEFVEECETCGRTYTVTVEYDHLGEPSIQVERPD